MSAHAIYYVIKLLEAQFSSEYLLLFHLGCLRQPAILDSAYDSLTGKFIPSHKYLFFQYQDSF